MADTAARGRMNWLLRRVQPEIAEGLVHRITAILVPDALQEAPVTMPDAVAAICAVLANIVVQASEKQQPLLMTALAELIASNVENAKLVQAVNAAAATAGEAAPQ
jgi:hypothetical protein